MLSGQRFGRCRRLPRASSRKLLQDLGWTPLWDAALVGAVVLRQRMALDPLCYAHAAVARDVSAPTGTWTSCVVRTQARFGIPEFCLGVPCETCSAQTIRCKLQDYKVKVVEPSIRRGLGHDLSAAPLPWGWIAVELSSRSQAETFGQWWRLRVLGSFDRKHNDCCPACGAPEPPDADNFSARCLAAAAACAREHVAIPSQRDLFAYPTSALMFRAQLACVAALLTS